MKNHDNMLIRWRWAIHTDQFKEMESFMTDCIQYVFDKPLNKEEQLDLIDFLKDSDHANTISPLDFCNYFLSKDIPFGVKFKPLYKLGLKKNLCYLRIVLYLKKALRCMNREVIEE